MSKTGAGHQCRNCGATLGGMYCGDCGQRALAQGLNTPEIASEMLDSVVRLDGRLWRTLIALTRSPGEVAADYVEGKRARYVNPIRYCIAAVALSIAATLATGELEKISDNILFYLQADKTEPLTARFVDFFSKYLNVVSLAGVPIIAFFLRWFFASSGRNFAESFSFTCFAVGHAAFLSVFATLVNSYVIFLGILPAFLINNFVMIYGAMVFFRRGFWYSLTMASLANLANLLALAVPLEFLLVLYPSS